MLHSLGYTHGDLKTENICLRETKDGRLKFTLIDFGICQELPVAGRVAKKSKFFRGNYMFCSERQLLHQRPTQLCDLISLLHVGYYFVYKDIPSTEYAMRLAHQSGQNLFKSIEFKQFRQQHKSLFEMEMCGRKNPFYKLAKYLYKKLN